MWDSIAYLVGVKVTVDDVGDRVETETFTEIFCNELSIGQTEFYQAQANGLKAEIKLEINRFEYANETKVKYNDVIYKVLRTYSKGEDVLEITLGGNVNEPTF